MPSCNPVRDTNFHRTPMALLFVSLRVVPGGIVSSCLLRLRGLDVLFCSVCSSRFHAGVGVSLLPVLPFFSCLCSSCLLCPAGSLFCVLVQLTLLCAGASFGVSGCSCDGSVALLSMLGVWSCFVFLPSFGSWQQRLFALCGFFL